MLFLKTGQLTLIFFKKVVQKECFEIDNQHKFELTLDELAVVKWLRYQRVSLLLMNLRFFRVFL